MCCLLLGFFFLSFYFYKNKYWYFKIVNMKARGRTQVKNTAHEVLWMGLVLFL